ncbi:hypothetical protein NST21_08860 [Peribacillus sp. FSL K6-1552]|uniref:hypothetical protein n=1 Tax=Peribacillus sp. FSL K6-1552 TaxID=2954514 RepID=UPI0030FC8FB2
MSQTQVIKVKGNIKPQEAFGNKTMELSKSQLDERINVNLGKIINGFRNLPSFLEAKENINKDSIYKVIIPKNISRKLEDGSAQWNYDKAGKQLPVIKDQNGSFICQARLEETDPANFSAVNNIALQSTMAAVLEQLEYLNEQVADVIEGQFTDRIGTIKGAEETYKQALLAKDLNIRKQLLTQAISELNKGRSQLIESLETKTKFIQDLPKSNFKLILYSLFQKIDTNKIQKQFLETQRIFDNIISSSSYIALAYEELGEISSLQESLLPLKKCIIDYSEKLELVAEFLPYNPKFENEKSWFKYPEKTLEKIDTSFSQLTSNKTDYIEIELTGELLLSKGEKGDGQMH